MGIGAESSLIDPFALNADWIPAVRHAHGARCRGRHIVLRTKARIEETISEARVLHMVCTVGRRNKWTH